MKKLIPLPNRRAVIVDTETQILISDHMITRGNRIAQWQEDYSEELLKGKIGKVIASTYELTGVPLIQNTYDELVKLQAATRIEKLAVEFAKKCDPLNTNLEKQADIRMGVLYGIKSNPAIYTREQMKEAIKLYLKKDSEYFIRTGKTTDVIIDEIIESLQPQLQKAEVEIEIVVETSGIDWNKMKEKEEGFKRKKSVIITKII